MGKLSKVGCGMEINILTQKDLTFWFSDMIKPKLDSIWSELNRLNKQNITLTERLKILEDGC